MNIFGINDSGNVGRGVFVRMQLDASGSNGVTIDFPTGGEVPVAGKDALLITSYSFQKGEAVALVKCFKDKSYVYAFGDDINQSQMSVTAVVFLTTCRKEDATGATGPEEDGFTRLKKLYSTNRLSAVPDKTLKITYGGDEALEGLLTKLAITSMDPKTRTATIDMGMILVNAL